MDPFIYPELLEEGMCLCTVTNAEMNPTAYRRVDRTLLARTSTSYPHFTTPEDQRPKHLGGSDKKFLVWEWGCAFSSAHGRSAGVNGERGLAFIQSDRCFL